MQDRHWSCMNRATSARRRRTARQWANAASARDQTTRNDPLVRSTSAFPKNQQFTSELSSQFFCAEILQFMHWHAIGLVWLENGVKRATRRMRLPALLACRQSKCAADPIWPPLRTRDVWSPAVASIDQTLRALVPSVPTQDKISHKRQRRDAPKTFENAVRAVRWPQNRPNSSAPPNNSTRCTPVARLVST